MDRRGELTGPAARTARGAKILVIDDEVAITSVMRSELEREGYRVETAPNGAAGLERIRTWQPDVVVLDRLLPGDMDGIEVCRQAREMWPRLPIIVLSVLGDGQDKVLSLDTGAYDHVVKPFHMQELIARIRVGLRHASGTADSCFRSGKLVVDFDRAQVTKCGVAVKLTPKEYEVIKYLAQNADLVITYRVLLRDVWGVAYEDAIKELRVFICKIRQKIEPNSSRPPRYLLTVTGVGYRLAVLPVE